MEIEIERRGRPPRRHRRRRSLFWPSVLIGAGALWLLANLNVISGEDLAILLRLWPLLLVVAGLDMLVGRSPLLSGLIGLGAVALAVALVLVGPSLGLAGEEVPQFLDVPLSLGGAVETQSGRFSAPLDEARSARVELDLGFTPTTVSALSDPEALIDADLTYVGDILFEVSGESQKTVSLGQGEVPLGWWPFDFGDAGLHWDIGLSPEVPLDLSVDAGTGPVWLDLSGLQLAKLKLDGGPGPVKLSLPAGDEPYEVVLEVGPGPLSLVFGDEADVSVRLEAAVGPVTLDVPGGAAARFEVRDEGVGPVSVSGGLVLVDDGGDDDPDTGTWQTPGFDEAEHRLDITVVEVGAGPVSVR